MVLSIDFTPREEAWLAEEAARKGIAPAEIVRRLVDERLESAPDEGVPLEEFPGESAGSAAPSVQNGSGADAAKNAAAIAYLRRRMRAEATTDPDEMRKADEELAEFRRQLNANRLAAGEVSTRPT